MPTPQEDQVNAQLKLLLSLQLQGMDQGAQVSLVESMQRIKEEYGRAVELGKTSKYYNDLADSIAKNLPGMVKGAYTASQAFKNGDYISGSAALMDICASVIPVFASLASAGGPPGALIGALFSVIGQILSFFAPKQPSLEEKIEKMLQHLRSEEQVQSMMAVGHSVSSYTASLRAKCIGEYRVEGPVLLAGTVALSAGSATVSGAGTAFAKALEVGHWLSFDADSSRQLYKIAAIAGESSLTLTVPYTGATLASSPVRQLQRVPTRKGIADILAMPLQTEDQADDFIVEMTALELGLMRDQQKLDVPVFASWKVAAYLERQETQGHEGWPEVLGIWCRTYTDLLSANMMLACLADPKTLDARISETQVGNKESQLPAETKAQCHNALLKLKALISMLRLAWKTDKAEMLRIVQAVTPVARERGLYAHVGELRTGHVLFTATGEGTRKKLDWIYRSEPGWLGTISIHVPTAQKDSFTPTYTLVTSELSRESFDNTVWFQNLDSVTGTVSGRVTQIRPRTERGDTFLDASAIALSEADGLPGQTTLVAIALEDRGAHPYSCLNLYTLDKDNKNTRRDWEPHVERSDIIRALKLPATPLRDDPDAAALADAGASPAGPALVAANPSIIYGGTSGSAHVWMAMEGQPAAFALPTGWTSYNGIEVDPDHVWVFGKGGVACASHASMLRYRQGNIAQPAWLRLDFDAQFKAPEVSSLSVAADGTLILIMLHKIYTADYQIDRAAGRIKTSAWFERGGFGTQVVKMPIACWPALESLRANLQAA